MATATIRPVAATWDGVLPPSELSQLLEYAVYRESEFVDTQVLGADDGAVSVVDRNMRRNTHLRGTANVPCAVMRRLKEYIPVLARSIGQDDDRCSDGVYEAEITATGHGGFFTAHVDDANARVRDRSISFVLFFSECPRPFRGGHLCIERDWRDDDQLFIFDAVRDGRLSRSEVAEIIEPKANRLVVFASHRLHEVRPVWTRSSQFRCSRFTVTGFLRSSDRR